MTRNECKELLSRFLGLSRADETFINFTHLDTATLPFARNTILPSSSATDDLLQVSVRVGRRYAAVSGNRLDESSVKDLLERAVRIAQRLPEAEQVFPFAGPVEVHEAPLWNLLDSVAADSWRADAVATAFESARQADLLAAGKASTSESFTTLADSRGLFLFQPSTSSHFQLRVMTGNGSSSGFAEQRAGDISRIAPKEISGIAVNKCLAWKNAVDIKPTRLTTIFEAPALAEFMLPFLRQFDTQAIAENRSFVRKLDGSSFVGSKLFTNGLDIMSDPFHPVVPSFPFSLDGMAHTNRYWVKNGAIESVVLSRADAQKSGQTPLPFPTNMLMSGGDDTLEALIASTSKALLVSGMGSLSMEDPTNCLLTGPTKDGLFLVEDGKITRGVKNLILRETPVYFFQRMDKAGRPIPVHPRNIYFPMMLPPLRVIDVMYTRVSGSV